MDRASIVRDLVMGKIPYAADGFYEKEAKQKRKDPLFRFKFEDLMIKVEERAQILKAQGKSATGGTENQTAKVAATTTNSEPRSYNIVKEAAKNNAFSVSPPKQQPQLYQRPQEKCIICNFNHNIKECPRMKSMTTVKRLEELKRRGICFRCLEGGHMARGCPQAANVRCSECNGRHQTLLHGRVGAQQQNPEQQQQPQEQAVLDG